MFKVRDSWLLLSNPVSLHLLTGESMLVPFKVITEGTGVSTVLWTADLAEVFVAVLFFC